VNDKLLLTAKIILFLLLSWFVIEQLFLKNDFKAQWDFFLQHFNSDKVYLFVLALLLMPLNWTLETIKWKKLLKSETPFFQLLKSVIAGLTVGFVTPGRSGEFAGRVLFLGEENKMKAFYLSVIGGIAQNAVTLATGAFFIYTWRNSYFLTEIVTGLAVAYLLFYFRFDLVNRYLLSNSFFRRYGLVILDTDLPDIDVQVKVLGISWMRFMVYLSQCVLLLSFFGVNSEYFSLFVHSIVFLIAQTFSPLMPLLDVSYRGGTALYVFEGFSDNHIAVLSAVLMMWLINLAIPAMMGYLFILRKKANMI